MFWYIYTRPHFCDDVMWQLTHTHTTSAAAAAEAVEKQSYCYYEFIIAFHV